MAAVEIGKVVKLSFPVWYNSVIRQFSDNLGQIIHLWQFQTKIFKPKYSQAKIQDGRPYKMVIFGISIIVRHVSGPLASPLHPPWSSETNFFCSFLCSFRWNMLPLSKIGPKDRKIQNSCYPERYFLWNRISFDIIMLQRSVIPLFLCFLACWMQWNTQKVITVNV